MPTMPVYDAFGNVGNLGYLYSHPVTRSSSLYLYSMVWSGIHYVLCFFIWALVWRYFIWALVWRYSYKFVSQAGSHATFWHFLLSLSTVFYSRAAALILSLGNNLEDQEWMSGRYKGSCDFIHHGNHDTWCKHPIRTQSCDLYATPLHLLHHMGAEEGKPLYIPHASEKCSLVWTSLYHCFSFHFKIQWPSAYRCLDHFGFRQRIIRYYFHTLDRLFGPYCTETSRLTLFGSSPISVFKSPLACSNNSG